MARAKSERSGGTRSGGKRKADEFEDWTTDGNDEVMRDGASEEEEDSDEQEAEDEASEALESLASDNDADDPLASTSDPATLNPYTILNLAQTATADDIKRAYRRLALQHHPDKLPLTATTAERSECTARFHALSLAHTILSHPTHRARYDATGHVPTSASALADPDAEGADGDVTDWAGFFRAQRDAQAFSSEAIEAFKRSYKGSEEERGDVIGWYRKLKGDMRGMMQCVMACEVGEDEERFVGYVEAAIEEREVERFPKWDKWVTEWELEEKVERGDTAGVSQRDIDAAKKRLKRRNTERKGEEHEARLAARELGVEDQLFDDDPSSSRKRKSRVEDDDEEDDEDEDVQPQPRSSARPDKKPKNENKSKSKNTEDALASLIRSRQQSRAEDFLAGLEAKYAPKTKTKSKAKSKTKSKKQDGSGMEMEVDDDEPPEEAFRAMDARRKESKKARR